MISQVSTVGYGGRQLQIKRNHGLTRSIHCIFQVSFLEVVIPPDFIPEETSGDVMAPEGSTVKLTCNARGHPKPSIIWRRENEYNITLKASSGSKTQGKRPYHTSQLSMNWDFYPIVSNIIIHSNPILSNIWTHSAEGTL
jgi:hypothetical protein